MLIRVARQSHRRLPPKAEATPSPAARPSLPPQSPSPQDEDQDTAFEEWFRQGEENEARAKLHSRQASGELVTEDEDSRTTNVERKLARWGLRDWSDVVGAAALAGFSDKVIARTTRRCADLFGQGMEIRRFNEGPASRGSGMQSVQYQPQKVHLSSSDGSNDESSDEHALFQRRLTSRQASLARSSRESTSDRGRKSPRTPSHAPSQSLSRSRSRSRSSAGQFFCPVASCDRAANGFTRRTNLRRHMELVHPGHDGEDVDSDDEVVGAVHVDGFLKPIVPSRGWRGQDTARRKKKKFYGGREASTSRSRAMTSESQVDSSD